MKADEEYRQVCRDSSRKWRSQNPDYWRQYREKHPESVAQNREKQQARDRRQHLCDLANNTSALDLKHSAAAIWLLNGEAVQLANNNSVSGKVFVIEALPRRKGPGKEVQAILDAPDPQTWQGQRDRVLLNVLYNTGARVSEAIGIKVSDVIWEGSPNISLHGKGRKDRAVPIWPATAVQIRRWLAHIERDPTKPLFPVKYGGPLTRSAVTDRLRRAVHTAVANCASLSKRHVSPHTFRHTTAMHLLHSGVDITLIALWLGHESTATTHIYVEADLKMKEAALKVIEPPGSKQIRYRPPEGLLHFLQGL